MKIPLHYLLAAVVMSNLDFIFTLIGLGLLFYGMSLIEVGSKCL